MSTLVRLLPLIFVYAAAQAFAVDPAPSGTPASTNTSAPSSSPPASPSATASPADTPPVTATPPATATSNPAHSAAGEPNAEQLRQILAQGYRREKHGGETLYCRREQVMGSRFEKTICKTAYQIAEQTQMGRDLADMKERPSGNRPGGK